jgi:hypothetical protein
MCSQLTLLNLGQEWSQSTIASIRNPLVMGDPDNVLTMLDRSRTDPILTSGLLVGKKVGSAGPAEGARHGSGGAVVGQVGEGRGLASKP